MTLGETIRLLLDERKRVIFPGFGNLQVQEASGDPPAGGTSLPPPGPVVRFDASFSNDDGVVAAAWSEAAGIDPEEASQQVLELVDAIRFALDKGIPFTLEGTGGFSRDDDGKVHFRKDPDWILEPDQFGLEPVDLLELDEEEPAAPEKEPGTASGEGTDTQEGIPTGAEETEKKPVEPARPPVRPAPPPPTPSPSYEPWKLVDNNSRRTRVWRVIWITAGLLIVVLVVLLLVPTDRLGFFGGRDLEIPLQEQPVPAEGIPDREGPVLEQGPVPDPRQADDPGGSEETDQAAQDQAPVQEREQGNDFYIIAGSFRHLSYASELQDRLKARGYEAEVMMTENRMYRVSVASYPTQQEAERALAGVKSEPGLESAWLLSNR